MTGPKGFPYINAKFTRYCRDHADNVMPPFEMYTRFLAHAKEHEHYGWMALAKEHRSALLKTAYSILTKIYGHEAIQKAMTKS